MTTLLIEYRVEDFEGWKTVFDRDPMGRERHGVTAHRLYQDADDPNHLMVTMNFPSTEQARAFLDLLRPVWEMSGAAQAWVLKDAEATAS
jgi:hypothetical protein